MSAGVKECGRSLVLNCHLQANALMEQDLCPFESSVAINALASTERSLFTRLARNGPLGSQSGKRGSSAQRSLFKEGAAGRNRPRL
jgi:hypothetical protein